MKYSLLLIPLLFLSSCSQITTPIPDEGDYYETLVKNCKNDTCCLSSVEAMKQGGFHELIGDICPSGFTRNMQRCVTSKRWCTPTLTIPKAQDKEQLCKAQGGKYDHQYMECENISEKACAIIGGIHEDCGSECRHMKDVDSCITVCAEYCKL